jgi:hypothetical protein
MAGYWIYSLDWDKFQKFANRPTKKQLLAFAEHLAEQLDGDDVELADDDPIHEWPREPAELCSLVKARLARPDWYGDLSDAGKSVWSEAVSAFCCEEGAGGVGLRRDHDGIYWDLLDLAWKQLNVPTDQVVPEVALSAFGQRPYRYHPDPDAERDLYAWNPMHSMHTPDEVRQILEELQTVAPAIEASKKQRAIHDYDALVPVLEKLAEENRMLFIQVDT